MFFVKTFGGCHVDLFLVHASRGDVFPETPETSQRCGGFVHSLVGVTLMISSSMSLEDILWGFYITLLGFRSALQNAAVAKCKIWIMLQNNTVACGRSSDLDAAAKVRIAKDNLPAICLR